MTSIFPKETPKSLGPDFKKTLEFRSATPNLLSNYKDEFDTIELGKLAIDYSDGVLLATAHSDATLQKYAKDKGLPIQKFLAEDYGEAYEAFYDSICPEEQQEWDIIKEIISFINEKNINYGWRRTNGNSHFFL